MENNHKKKKYGAGMLAVSLVLGLSIGFCAGFMMGGHTSSSAGMAAGADQLPARENVQMAESETSGNVADSILPGSTNEKERIPDGSFAVDDEPVLTINDMTIYLSEVNARIYMVRDRYVSLYGEEPWNQEMEDGITVGEFAKAAMLEEMKRVTILCGKADEYGVEALTEDEAAKCESQADDYMASLGPNVAAQFSVDREVMQNIYEKDALSMKVYNKILEELTVSLRNRDDYKDMDDSEFETMLMEEFNRQYEQWEDVCKIETTETWNQIVIGAVG